MDLNSLLISIQSSKVKERSEALNDLEFTLDSSIYINNLSVKTTIHVIESLYNSIEFETRSLLSKQTNLVELRVLRCFKLIKSLVSSKIKNLKKAVQYLNIIDQLFVSLKSLIQFPAITLEPLKLLSLLTSNITLFFSMSDNDYSKLCKKLLQLFDDLLAQLYPDTITTSTSSNSHLLVNELLQSMDNCITNISSLPSPKLILFKNGIYKQFTYSLIAYLNIVNSSESTDSSGQGLCNTGNASQPLDNSKTTKVNQLSLSLIFEISTVLLTYNSLQFADVLQTLVTKLFQIIPSINLFNYSLLKRSLLTFVIVSSDFSNFRLNNIVNRTSSTQKQLISMIKHLLQFLGDNYLDPLEFLQIGFYHNNIHHRYIRHWFKLDYIYLEKLSNMELQWLSNIGFIKLINLYYALNEKCAEDVRMITVYNNQDQVTNEPNGNNRIQYAPALKRRKLNDSVINIVFSNTNLNDLFLDLLSSKHYIYGCIFLCFHLSINHDGKIFHKELLVTLMESLNNNNQESVEPYLLLAIKVVLDDLSMVSKESYKGDFNFIKPEIEIILKSGILLRVLKISIQSIKYQNLCDISCSLVSTILNFNSSYKNSINTHILTDLSLTRLVQSTVDEININGPYYLNNYSLIFWICIISSSLSSNLEKSKSLIIKITSWVHSKSCIDQFDSEGFKGSTFQGSQPSINNGSEFFRDSRTSNIVENLDSSVMNHNSIRCSFSLLGLFIGWLFGNDVSISISDDELYGINGDLAYSTIYYDRSFMNVSILWLSTKSIRDFIDISKTNICYNYELTSTKDNQIKVKPIRSLVSSSQFESFFLEIFKKIDKLSKSLNLVNNPVQIHVAERLIFMLLIINDIYSLMMEVPQNNELDNSLHSKVDANASLTVTEALQNNNDFFRNFGRVIQFKIRSINDALLSSLFSSYNVESIAKILNMYNNYLCSSEIAQNRKQSLINCFPDSYKFAHDSLEFLKRFSTSNGNLDFSDSGTDNSTRSGTPVETWNSDENFGKVRKLRDRKIQENNKKWKNFRLYSSYDLPHSIDKVILKFLINSNVGKTNLDITEFLRSYTSEQFLNCCDYLLYAMTRNSLDKPAIHLDSASMTDNTSDIFTHKIDPDKLIRLIGEKLLQLPKLEINEIAICFVCKFLNNLIDKIGKESDFIDIFRFLLNMDKHNIFNGVESLLAFQELKNKIVKVAYISKLNLKQNKTIIFSDLINIVYSMNPLTVLSSTINLQVNFLTSNLSKSYSSFFKNAPTNCIVSVYRELYSSFDTPQQNMESFGTFCYFLVQIAKYSDYIKVSTTFNILEFTAFPSFMDYIIRSVQLIIANDKISSTCNINLTEESQSSHSMLTASEISHIFFKKYSLYLLTFWQMLQKNSNVLDFPFQIFLFESRDQFIRSNYKVMIALIMNLETSESYDSLIYEISKIMKISVKLLITESLPEIVSLSFSNHGKRNSIFPILNHFLGEVDYEREMKTNLEIIILKVLQLIDLVSPKSIHVFNPNYTEFSEVEPPMVFISAKTGKFLIESLIAIHANSDVPSEAVNTQSFWHIKALYFFLRHLILDFESTTSLSIKLLSLRRLSVVCSFNLEILKKSSVIINCLISSLADYISNNALQIEISNFLVTILSGIKIDDTTSRSIMNLGTKLCKFYIAGQLLDTNPLTKWLLNFSSEDSSSNFAIKSSLSSNLQDFVLPIFSKILSNSIISSTASELERIITAFTSTHNMSSHNKWLSDFVLLLFEVDNGQNSINKIEPSTIHEKYVVQFLLSIKKIPYRSNKMFNEWMINYLGYFYFCTGYNLRKSTSNKDLLFVERIFQKKKILYIMSVILRDFRIMLMEPDTPISIQCLMESFIGSIIKYEKMDPKTFSFFGDFKLLYSEVSGYILDTSYSSFRKLYGNIEDSMHLENNDNRVRLFENTFDNDFASLSFDQWCTKFIKAIVLELAPKYVFLESFIIFFENVPQYSKKILANLIIFYIQDSSETDGSGGSMILSNIIHKYLNYSNKSIESMEFFIDLSLRLSIAYQYNISDKKIKSGCEGNTFSQSFLNKFYFPLSQIASELKLWKVALMFYELSQNSLDHTKLKVESPDIYQTTLKTIYDSLDVKDICYSMPLKSPSIDTALDLIYRENNSERIIFFNNSLVEANIRYQNTALDSAIPIAVNSMQHNGLLGLSKFVINYYSEEIPAFSNLVNPIDQDSHDKDSEVKKVDEVYKWAWKLGQWNLPTENDAITYNNIIYSSLKSFKTGSHAKNNERQIETILRWYNSYQSKKKFERNQEPLKVLGIKWMLSNIIQSSYAGNLFRLQVDNKSWIFEKNFDDIEDILEAKQICLGFRQTDSSTFYKIVELFTYGNLARINKEPQKAINSMMTIRNIINNEIDTVKSESLKKSAIIIANFSYALNLWDQKETYTPIQMMKNLKTSYNDIDSQLLSKLVNKYLIDSILVDWLDISKQENSSSILRQYIQPYFESVDQGKNHIHLTKMNHVFAKFCDKQLKILNLRDEINRYQRIIDSKMKDLKETVVMDTTEARRYGYKLKRQILSDKNYMRSLIETEEKFIKYSIYFYFQSIVNSDEYIDTDVDRFFGLWFKYSDDSNVNNMVDKLFFKASNSFQFYKVLSSISQLFSKLAMDSSIFQNTLKKILTNVTINHPYHCLFILKSLMLQKEFNTQPDSIMKSRITAATDLWSKIRESDASFASRYMNTIDQFVNECVKIANFQISKNMSQLQLSSIQSSSFWNRLLPSYKLVLPTNDTPIKKISSEYNSLGPSIKGISNKIFISATGVSRPKIVIFELSDGTKHRVLFKGNTDDLRQDAIMEQIFTKVNKMLSKEKEISNRKLKMRTYNVVPLGPQAGLIEFVANSISFLDAIYSLHSKFDSVTHQNAVKKMSQWEGLSLNERIANFKNQLYDNGISPVFHQFFFVNYINPHDWFQNRINYSRGTATCSIVGYILGLGDRHCNNILIDKTTGEPIHIDLGIAFDQGKLLSIPETVPFRLTRDIVDGFGVSGVEGIFRKSCEMVFTVLRDNKEHINGILEILKWDPLYMWTISPLRKKRLQENDDNDDDPKYNDIDYQKSRISFNSNKEVEEGLEATRAVMEVSEKLKAKGLSAEGVVRELILTATDYKMLALLFRGWAPFY